MSNVLTVPASGAIYFDSGTAGSSTVPALTSGVSLNYDGGAGLNITSYNPSTSATDRFSVDGANGRLFSVSDALTGVIFSVNDAAGLPIIEVNSTTTDVINIGTYGTNALVVSGNNVGIGAAIPNERLTVSGNISASGNITGSNLVYTTDDQTIGGSKTFTNDIQINGQITAPNQTLINSTSLINSNLLIPLMENTGFGQYVAFSGNTGTNSQFAAQGGFGFAVAPLSGTTAAHITYMFTTNTAQHDTSVASIPGAGYFILSYTSPFTIGFGFTTPINNTATDVDVRFIYGTAISPYTGRITTLAGRFGGWGLKMVKHPTNNSYITRLFTRSFDNAGSINISNCTNTSPITVTTTQAHNLSSSERVEIVGVAGNTAANGEWIVTVLSPTTISLSGSVGNGVYTANTGTIVRISPDFIEMPVSRYYKGFFNWDPTTDSVSFHLGSHTTTPSLTSYLWSGANTLPGNSFQTGHTFRAGIASITDATAYLRIQMSTPTIYQY